MKRRSLKIIKIPGEKSPNYKQEFVPQPVNYLKIIENKFIINSIIFFIVAVCLIIFGIFSLFSRHRR